MYKSITPESCQIWMRQNILVWPCCTQATGISLWAVVKRSKRIHRYKQILHSLDPWIDNLDTIMDFIQFISQFCQFHDNSTSVIIPVEPQFMPYRQGVLGNLIVFWWSLSLITITIMESNMSIPNMQGSHPTHRWLVCMLLNKLRSVKNMRTCWVTQAKASGQVRPQAGSTWKPDFAWVACKRSLCFNDRKIHIKPLK